MLLIEHHLDVIKTADHVIDLGPEGGHAGGEVVVTGTPEEVAACKASHTGSVPEGAPEVLRRELRFTIHPTKVGRKAVISPAKLPDRQGFELRSK